MKVFFCCLLKGVDEIRTYPIKRRLKHIYCMAVKIDDHTCNILMTDEEENILLKVDGFKVSKDYIDSQLL